MRGFLPRGARLAWSAVVSCSANIASLLLKGGRRATSRAYVIVLTSQSRTRAFLSRGGLVRFTRVRTMGVRGI